MTGVQRVPPLSNQVGDILRMEILEGKYPPGGQIPAEEALATRFLTSRATIRSAIAGLAAEGLLDRKQGSGTFVTPRPLQSGLERLESVIAIAARDGVHLAIRELNVREIKAPQEIARVLGVKPGTILTTVSRILLADSTPLSKQDDYVLASVLSVADLGDTFNGSVLDLIRRNNPGRIARAVSVINAVAAHRELSKVLEVEPGTSLLRFDDTLLDISGEPIGFSYNYYVPGKMRFVVVRK